MTLTQKIILIGLLVVGGLCLIVGFTLMHYIGGFLRTVEEAGRTGMLYCNGVTGYFFYDMAQLQDFPVWYASYSTGWPNYYYGVDLWQYSSTGRVQGIEGDVDLNLWPQTADGLLPFGESESGNAAASESGNAAMSESGNAAMVSGAGAS